MQLYRLLCLQAVQLRQLYHHLVLPDPLRNLLRLLLLLLHRQ